MKPEELKHKRVTFTFPPKLILLLQEKSKETGLTMSDIVRRAIEYWSEKNGK